MCNSRSSSLWFDCRARRSRATSTIHSRQVRAPSVVVRHLGLDRLSPHSTPLRLLFSYFKEPFVSAENTHLPPHHSLLRRLHIMLGGTTKIFSNWQTSRDPLKKIVRRRRGSGLDVAIYRGPDRLKRKGSSGSGPRPWQ